METVTIRFAVGGREAEALRRLAFSEFRTPRDQVRVVLRQELERRGLLEKEAQHPREDPQS